MFRFANFGQDAAAALGVDEGDLVVMGSAAGLFIDHADALGLEFIDAALEVFDRVGHVMQALAAFLTLMY